MNNVQPSKSGSSSRVAVNLLDEWYKEALVASSPLAIKPKADRNTVEYIYKGLTDFLGHDYFIPAKPDTPIEEINWIHSLLASKRSFGCYQVLREICALIEYYNTIKCDVGNFLDGGVKDCRILRAFFFELLIYRQLDRCQVPNTKKAMVNEREKEGFCEVNGRTFLFECKKAYYPRLESLDVLYSMHKMLIQKPGRFQNTRGMILSIRDVQKPLKKKHKEAFRKILPKLSEWNRGLNESAKEFEADFLGGKIKMQIYDEATLAEAKILNKYDLLFYTKLAINPQGKPYLAGKLSINFSMYQNEIFKKLETILNDAKDQHRDYDGPKIIFIDTEAYPEFRMGLFQTEQSLRQDEIERIINKMGFRDSIICILRRTVSEDSYTVKAYFYAPPELKNDAECFGRLFEKTNLDGTGTKDLIVGPNQYLFSPLMSLKGG